MSGDNILWKSLNSRWKLFSLPLISLSNDGNSENNFGENKWKFLKIISIEIFKIQNKENYEFIGVIKTSKTRTNPISFIFKSFSVFAEVSSV